MKSNFKLESQKKKKNAFFIENINAIKNFLLN